MKSRTLLANLTSSSPKFALHLGQATSRQGASSLDDVPRTHSWKSNTISDDPIESKTPRRQGGGVGGVGGVFGSIAVIPAVGTLLQVTAVNAHGTSDPVYIEATSVAGLPAEKQTGAVSNFEFTPTLGILLGIVATGVVLMLALITGLRLRCNNKKRSDKELESKKDYIELGTKDPDLITQDRGKVANTIIATVIL